jgi:hypothetical protein
MLGSIDLEQVSLSKLWKKSGQTEQEWADFYRYWIFTKTRFLLDVYQNQNWISFIENLFIKIDFTVGLDYVYLGPILLGIGLITCSTVFYFFLGGI